ncbi:hypothetical protein C1I98_11010 [Spongiactinospora gelatinilytica]|uniref:Secreted protein n=1 Tax=Spongiactinospora gelatinilytica TaxID=2666298 RepID=A0A2W2HJJ1_9ACTN|nr:HAD domain-containing protein [Spongiactinospora gelatinilytica]PZG49838.1 hypothetical protein C1I98_11010 [Spongiactinospora gelatinilytica]
MKPPLILLDVDGVTAPFFRPGPEWRRHSAVSDGRTYQVWLNPAVGAQLLTLAEQTGAELTWCTSWDHDANTAIAPLIGLPELPVCVVDQDAKWAAHLTADLCFKTGTVADYAAGRPFVWFDDYIGLGDARYLADRADVGDYLLITVEPRRGLTLEHLEQARAWLAERGGS